MVINDKAESSPSKSSVCSQEESLLWAHNAEGVEAISPIEPEAEVNVMVEPPMLNLGPTLSLAEVQALRMLLNKPARNPNEFKVPRDHPIYDGTPEKLDTFIREMKLFHGEYTTGDGASKDSTHFIQKLICYFTKGSAVRKWFENYAIERQEAGKVLSWELLVTHLRKDFGDKNNGGKLFNNFWNMTQGTDSIPAYIAKKKSAALLAKKNLTPELLLEGFVQGLRVDIEDYVRLRHPATVEKAQRIATDYELLLSNSKGSKKRVSFTVESKELVPASIKAGKRQKENPSNTKRAKIDTPEKQAALAELRSLRNNKCFACGKSGHRNDKCVSSEADKEQHREKILGLKNRLNA